MTAAAISLSPRGPDRAGLRLRGLAALLIVAVLVTAWVQFRPEPRDQVGFTVLTTAVGDGVEPGTPVRLRGMRIGEITEIGTGPRGRRLTVRIDAPRLAELSTTTRARFVSANVFGSTALEFVPAAGGRPLAAGDVLDIADRAGNYTVTGIMRDSGRVVAEVLTARLAESVRNSADLVDAGTGMVAAAVLVLRVWQQTEHLPVTELVPKLAGMTEGFAAFGPSSLGILHALSSVDELDDTARTRQASDTISEVSNLVFAFAGEIVGALGPTSRFVDMLLDVVIPMNHSMRAVTPEQIRRLLDGVGGALHQRAGRTVLDTEILLDMPAFRVPLQLLPGGVR
ncbi:MlaD family protein [Nocardia carnea]|uniref:MlaD family protein n=1 Tax=Nocardia carnea TaxID=37328 RepID=UPI0024564B1A|nr:MlaD family protein [Nocardia carnea]